MICDYLKTIPQFFLPKKSVTLLAGLMANVKTPAVKNFLITRFIRRFGVNMTEALQEDPLQYTCFNDFFIRHLKPACRPVADFPIVSPVDGIVSERGQIEAGRLLQAKGRYYSVQELLGEATPWTQSFINGRFMTLYLSPKDYHRIHMPITALLKEMHYIPGRLYSVQPSTVRTIPHLFARNERLAVFFETELGSMAMVLVGAVIVGAIGTSWHGDLTRQNQPQRFDYASSPQVLKQGEEMGYFKLGSTVILMFADGKRMDWLDTMVPGMAVRFGEKLGFETPCR